MSTSGGAGGGGLTATLHLPNTDINTLHSVPVELVAAPGANRLIIVQGATLEAVPGAHGNWFANSLALYYGAATSDAVKACENLNTSVAMLNANALPNAQQVETAPPTNNAPKTVSAIAGQPLVVGAQSDDPIQIGGLMALTIFDGGAGYVIGDTGTIDAGFYGGGAAYVIDTVGAAGIVTALTLTAAGTGYGQGDTEIGTTTGGAQPGVGTGLEVNITNTVQPLGDLYVTCSYRIITTH